MLQKSSYLRITVFSPVRRSPGVDPEICNVADVQEVIGAVHISRPPFRI